MTPPLRTLAGWWCNTHRQPDTECPMGEHQGQPAEAQA